MKEYSDFAKVYDRFMDNAPYDSWERCLAGILRLHGLRDGILLELGCGTGTMTERMAARGYDMIGIDSSAEMLSEAAEKRLQSGRDIMYLQQDMREFELYGTVAAAYSICDSLNYLTEPADLVRCFRQVNLYLDPGGVFVFDFNTPRTYLRRIRRIPRIEEKDGDTLIWENSYGLRDRINRHRVLLFEDRGDGSFCRSEEYHAQRAYTLGEIRRALKQAGLIYEKAYRAGTGRRAGLLTDRICVVARESGK